MATKSASGKTNFGGGGPQRTAPGKGDLQRSIHYKTNDNTGTRYGSPSKMPGTSYPKPPPKTRGLTPIKPAKPLPPAPPKPTLKPVKPTTKPVTKPKVPAKPVTKPKTATKSSPSSKSPASKGPARAAPAKPVHGIQMKEALNNRTGVRTGTTTGKTSSSGGSSKSGSSKSSFSRGKGPVGTGRKYE